MSANTAGKAQLLLEDLEDAVAHGLVEVDRQALGSVRLRVEVDQEGEVAVWLTGQARGEVQRRRGLGDATFLVGDGDDLLHEASVKGPPMAWTSAPAAPECNTIAVQQGCTVRLGRCFWLLAGCNRGNVVQEVSMGSKSPKSRRRTGRGRRLVPVEILLSEDERRAFRIAAIEEGRSMRDLGRMMITGWMDIRRLASQDLE